MKPRTFLLSLLLLGLTIVGLQGARRLLLTQRPGASGGGASCETTQDSLIGDDSGSVDLARFGVTKVAFKFTAASSYSVCKGTYRVNVVGSPTANGFMEIYTHDSMNDLPSALVTDATSSSEAISTWDNTEHTFTFSSPPSLTGSTVYWLVMSADSSNNSNYGLLSVQNGGPAVRTAFWDGGSWSYFADRTPHFTLFSE